MKHLAQATVTVVISAGLLAMAAHDAFAAPIVKQIYPPLPATGGPWVIAVLSDHYTGTDPTTFQNDVKRVFVDGLLGNINFRGFKSKFTITAIYDEFPSTDPTRPALGTASNYGSALASPKSSRTVSVCPVGTVWARTSWSSAWARNRRRGWPRTPG